MQAPKSRKQKTRGDASESLRIAVVQIETHPSLSIEGQNFMGEPFKAEKGMILADLTAWPKAGDLKKLQAEFRARYLHWAAARLHSILSWLEKLPLGNRPHLIVFPEFSIPF